MNLPLTGVRVVELGSSVAAPYATWILATLGAEVIKFERPGVGDDARGWGEHVVDGERLWFHALNANKRSVVVDLKNAAARERTRRFILDEADVVVQNMRPGALAKLGLDGASLLEANPRLIYCNIGAFGAEGPLRDRPGYDPLMQAFGGIMSVTGEDGRPPVRVGVSIIDMGTGMWCAIGVLAALHRRDVSGRGGVVDTALFETALAWMAIPGADYLASGDVPRRYGSGISGIVPYRAFACADGYLLVGGANDRLFAALCEVVGHPQWAQDPRFARNSERVQHRDAINEMLEAVFVTQPRAHWQQKLDDAGVPNAPTQDLEEVFAHEQTRALGIVERLGEHLRLLGVPVRLDGRRPSLGRGAPALGEHTREILGES